MGFDREDQGKVDDIAYRYMKDEVNKLITCCICGKEKVMITLKEDKKVKCFCSRACYKKWRKEQEELWDLHITNI